jgi:hypothetical protein
MRIPKANMQPQTQKAIYSGKGCLVVKAKLSFRMMDSEMKNPLMMRNINITKKINNVFFEEI